MNEARIPERRSLIFFLLYAGLNRGGAYLSKYSKQKKM